MIGKKIKYVITLDADTNLVLETGLELIGTMAHVLNEPELDKDKRIVRNGYALIQPRIGIDLISSRKSLFAQIFSGLGGTDLYANAISDLYQDNFNEGIFTGKGIYDLKIFHKLLCDEIPENIVLSHDLLEGSYLRCGLASDILLLDDTPSKYRAYIERQSRWIRGDWQISGWLKKKIKDRSGNKNKNPLSGLSKFKILDNLRRSMIPIFSFLGIILGFIMNLWQLVTISIISYVSAYLIDLIKAIIYKKETGTNFVKAHKNNVKIIEGTMSSFLRRNY